MTPSNPQVTPQVLKIKDSDGNLHTIAPGLHTHSISELELSQQEIANLFIALATPTKSTDSSIPNSDSKLITAGAVKKFLESAHTELIYIDPTSETGNVCQIDQLFASKGYPDSLTLLVDGTLLATPKTASNFFVADQAYVLLNQGDNFTIGSDNYIIVNAYYWDPSSTPYIFIARQGSYVE